MKPTERHRYNQINHVHLKKHKIPKKMKTAIQLVYPPSHPPMHYTTT
jgi:hypothetical protein